MNESIRSDPVDESVGSAPPPPEGPAPAQPAGRQNDPLFLVLGFVTPWTLYAIVNGLVDSTFDPWLPVAVDVGEAVVYYLTAMLPLFVLIGCLVLFLVGRARGNERLRSFGLGGLIAYAVTLALGLLLWGTCILFIGAVGL